MNWCGCTNYFLTGYTDMTGPIMSESEKASIQSAKHIIQNLHDNDTFLDHYLKYLHVKT